MVLVFTLLLNLTKRKQATPLTTSIIAGLLISLTINETLWQYSKHKGEHILQTISQNPQGELYCQRYGGAFIDPTMYLGYVSSEEPNRAVIKYMYCNILETWLLKPEGHRGELTEKETLSLMVLLHESIHVGGNYNEASTECYAQAYYVEYLTTIEHLNPTFVANSLEKYNTNFHSKQSSEYQMDCSTLQIPPLFS